MGKDSLTITDNRTGRQYEVAITDGAIKAVDLLQIRSGEDDTGLASYDPALQNTASCRSKVTFIDGDKASSSTAGIRSRNSRSGRATSRSPT